MTHLTKKEAFEEINKIQDDYISKLTELVNDPKYEIMKTINFTSATGTGKTKMMSKLINRFPDCFFIVTTLSKGQLHIQVRNNLDIDCNQDNFIVYGSADYRINSKLDAETIIGKIPANTKCIWLRDEGHIRTNRFDEILLNVCYKVINFSATNSHSDIQCNFTQTMMLRTVNQNNGIPEDAIKKLIEIKNVHKNVKKYNPCAIFRCIGGSNNLRDRIVNLCEQYNLKYIDINEDSYNMSELCEDDNEYDVIINKFKIVEGIDIRRAHVLYMDNQPANNATTIQAIGRCRRNALLYRDDIDILAPENEDLLKQTRECFIYYNVINMSIDSDENGELQYALRDTISCQELKPGMQIEVVDGQLPNGLHVIELKGETGKYYIDIDENTGFNIIEPQTDFYSIRTVRKNYEDDYILVSSEQNEIYKVYKKDIIKFPIVNWYSSQYYSLASRERELGIQCRVSNENTLLFESYVKTYSPDYIYSKLSNFCIENIPDDIDLFQYTKDELEDYISNKTKKLKKRDYNEYESIVKIIRFESNRNDINTDVLTFFEYCGIYFRDRGKSFETIVFLVKECYRIIKDVEVQKYKNNDNFNLILKKTIYLLFSKVRYENKTIECNWIKNPAPVSVPIPYSFEESEVEITDKDISSYFCSIDEYINTDLTVLFISRNDLNEEIEKIHGSFLNMLKEFNNNEISSKTAVVYRTYETLFRELSESESFLSRNGYIKVYDYNEINKDNINKLITRTHYMPFIQTYNDKESAIIGVDLMHLVKNSNNDFIWIESSSVSSKINNYNKFNSFLSDRYADELKAVKQQLFHGKNDFEFNKRCNSMLGYCVEYYSKCLVYGLKYLNDVYTKESPDLFKKLISHADEYDITKLNKAEKAYIVYLCMRKYKELMIRSFGSGVSKHITLISYYMLKDEYQKFVETVIELGNKTAEYVRRELYPDKEPINNIDPNLSINHISGLADYITQDTILDVKVRNNIDEICVRQVLAYHYLSTKRSDICIKRVIVYDAVSDKSVVVYINEKN